MPVRNGNKSRMAAFQQIIELVGDLSRDPSGASQTMPSRSSGLCTGIQLFSQLRLGNARPYRDPFVSKRMISRALASSHGCARSQVRTKEKLLWIDGAGIAQQPAGVQKVAGSPPSTEILGARQIKALRASPSRCRTVEFCLQVLAVRRTTLPFSPPQ